MEYPFISVIMPCRNEARFISRSVESILKNDYPKDKLEIIVVDGKSQDGTKEIIDEIISQDPIIKFFSNDKQIVSAALNIGIKQARGKILIRMDAHAEYPPDYIRKLVYWSEKTGAENVGGRWLIEPYRDTAKARAIAIVLAHPFCVANSLYRGQIQHVQEADAVAFGCYRREVFEKIGLFDERLVRNQDIEFNSRIKAKGGRVLLIPEIACTYFARGSYKELWRNNFQNGYWVVRTIFLTKNWRSHSLRHFVPFFFSVYVLLLSVSLFFLRPGIYAVLAVLPLTAYITLAVLFSLHIGKKYGSLKLIPYSLFAFFVFHISYGFGSLFALITTLLGRSK